MLFDTTFLIDLQREAIRNSPGRAFQFLESHPETPMQISVVTVGEFAEGFPEEKQELCTELLQPYEVIDVSYDVARHYARLSRELRRLGVRTGDNDLWIAATAIQRDVELVTRDAGHFSRVQDLKLVQY